MKILVIGSGGREHALAWKLAQSLRVQRVYLAPGNGGTGAHRRFQNVALSDQQDLIAFARSEGIGMTVVGPEAPLAAGIVDAFRAADLRIFGPTRAAARLEWSKDYAKAFMLRHSIPTAAYRSFTDVEQAHAYLRERGAPIVIKADGLAAGKGVVVAQSSEQAHEAVASMLGRSNFGAAGARVVIEDFLDGEEASFIVMCDGRHNLALATSQDHKRLLDRDRGPNTGGMGAYSPAPVVTPAIHARVMREIINPTIAGLASEGVEYSGFLYAGLMIDRQGQPRTLEFNCRLGDPETQPIMMRLKSDLVALLDDAIEGKLDRAEAQWDRRPALGVVVAAHGYPEQPRQGDVIAGLPPDTDDAVVFHAGTRLDQGRLLTSGGRVLCVTALGESLKAARRRAYESVAQVRFDGAQFRTDIGNRAQPGSQ
ncbi:phosphoribosylglycinamide synthetase phosphoribosylamine-glycine ligase [Burkholderiales bacterium]|nr:phosphoribosylglycinamide synthetase phosphoribosylamine-glycine ligase [Burkholderiales bacterium]